MRDVPQIKRREDRTGAPGSSPKNTGERPVLMERSRGRHTAETVCADWTHLRARGTRIMDDLMQEKEDGILRYHPRRTKTRYKQRGCFQHESLSPSHINMWSSHWAKELPFLQPVSKLGQGRNPKRLRNAVRPRLSLSHKMRQIGHREILSYQGDHI